METLILFLLLKVLFIVSVACEALVTSDLRFSGRANYVTAALSVGSLFLALLLVHFVPDFRVTTLLAYLLIRIGLYLPVWNFHTRVRGHADFKWHTVGQAGDFSDRLIYTKLKLLEAKYFPLVILLIPLLILIGIFI